MGSSEGGSAAYTVVLTARPWSDVVITVSSNNDDVTVSPPTLTFTNSDWSTEQTVTVSAAQDADAEDDSATITHTVDNGNSADEYDDVPIGGVSVRVADEKPVIVEVEADGALTLITKRAGTTTIMIPFGGRDRELRGELG